MPPFSVRSKSTHYTKSTSGSAIRSTISCKDTSFKSSDDPFVEPKFPIKKIEYVDGREYRKSSKPIEQFLPCDDVESERLQVNHLLFKSLFITQFFSPIEDLFKSGIKVLEVSAGPGFWLIDMAKEYPKSHFTGCDVMIYPINPPPTNCHFRVIDVAQGLPFADNSFDFVTQHDALLRYNQKDWETVLPELIRVCKPGGYVEVVEPAGVVQDIGPNMSIWLMRLTVSLQTRDVNLKLASQLQSMIEKLDGLENIEASHRSAPIGWYGRSGDIMLECLERLFDAIKPKLCADWSMSATKYDKVVSTASTECRDFRSWLNIHYVFGQKKKKTNQDEEV